MKILLWTTAILLGLSLFGCVSTQNAQHPPSQSRASNTVAADNPTKKDPLSVAIFTHGAQPTRPYKVLGKETVSKFNYSGVKKQEANICDSIRNSAANRGGDAVIDITNHANTVTGTVIIYENAAENASPQTTNRA